MHPDTASPQAVKALLQLRYSRPKIPLVELRYTSPYVRLSGVFWFSWPGAIIGRMSERETNESAGKVFLEYAGVKQSLEAIKTKLRQDGAELAMIAERLSSGAMANARTLLRKQLVEELGLERIAQLLDEHDALETRVVQLREQLEKLGGKL